MQIALDEILIDGIDTNISLQKKLVRDSNVQRGGVNIHYLEQKLN
jgi:acetyl-CoA carboxylase biotin carboxylase subunit